jgi:hypothetical protein
MIVSGSVRTTDRSELQNFAKRVQRESLNAAEIPLGGGRAICIDF